jgi:hypothetical protein
MISEKAKQTAEKLVTYCRENKTDQGLNELYDPAAVSVEAMKMSGSDSPESKGVAAIKAKHDWWYSAFDVHDSKVDGPHFHGENRFGVIFEFDATNKQSGERSHMKELGIYTTDANGKIVREEFYYAY